MRILFAGDTHGNTSHVRALIDRDKEEQCDRIFVLGDFGYWEHQLDGVTFLDRVSKYAIKNEISVYFLDGNHDKTSLLISKYQDQLNREGFMTVRGRLFYAPRGHQWTWGEVKFIALGGAYSVDKQWRLDLERKSKRPSGTYWFPEEEMTQTQFETIMTKARPVDVILAHDKPFDSRPPWNRKAFDECVPNQLRLQQAINSLHPSLFLHGHLHLRYTDFVNFMTETECMVEGLDCDPEAASGRWSLDKTYLILDTEHWGMERGITNPVAIKPFEPSP